MRDLASKTTFQQYYFKDNIQLKTLLNSNLKQNHKLYLQLMFILILIIAGHLALESAFINQNKKYFRIIFI
jgi:hypothetical protein